MFDSPGSDAYVERAVMHEQLAATTADGPARKMHQAMADAYRRKAEQAGARTVPSTPRDGISRMLVSSGY